MEKKSEQELIHIVEMMVDYDEVTDALIELKDRKSPQFVDMASKIIKNKLGDVYLQSMTFYLLYNANFNVALALLREMINEFEDYMLVEAMECLAVDSEVINVESINVERHIILATNDILFVTYSRT